MLRTKETLVNDWVKHQLDDERNLDVYEKRLTSVPPVKGYEEVPCCIYFYYVRVDRIGTVRVDHYFYSNGPDDAPEEWKAIPYKDMEDEEGLLKMLALNARPSGEHKWAMPNNSFRDVVWKHRSYIAIFFDERNWAFHQRDGDKPSVAFNVTEGRSPNRTFFDASDLVLEMPVRGRRGQPDSTDKRTAIFLVNHLKDDDDSNLPPSKQLKYKFDMYLQVQYAKSDAPAMTVIFDPDGTNQGPNT